MESPSIWATDLQEAWMDAVRAAEMAKRLAYAAAELGTMAGPAVIAGSADLAELAEHAARAAEAAAACARESQAVAERIRRRQAA